MRKESHGNVKDMMDCLQQTDTQEGRQIVLDESEKNQQMDGEPRQGCFEKEKW